MNFVTCFSMRANGWVNYNRPRVPNPKHIEFGRAIPFTPTNFGFGFAHKAHAEANRMPMAEIEATPREWVKNVPAGFYVD